MEHVQVLLGNDAEFDKAVHAGLPEGGDLIMITKDRATQAGRPAVCLAFTVQQTDGQLKPVQVVITGRNFAMMCAAFRGRYGENGDQVCTADQLN